MTKKSLVVVESPAKARTINKYLGKEFKVLASVGHIIDLPKNKFGVNIDDGFKPEYIKIKGKEKVIKELRQEASKANEVFIATDPDREGEAIAYHIASLMENDLIHRVEFNEITKTAVENAMSKPRTIDMDRVYSQQARRVLDRIVGYKTSPILWRTIYRGLSAGRVQSVALRLICEKEEQIRSFNPEEYWTIRLDVESAKKDIFEVKLVKINDKKAHIPDEKAAKEHSAAIRNASLHIHDILKKDVKRQPFPPFTTSTLQQSAARMLRMSTKRIMSIAQTLYEGVELPDRGSIGLITYMRTDSTRISSEAMNAVHHYIGETYGKDYTIPRPRFFKSKKSAQDAHEAIRPTYISKEYAPVAIKAHLSADQYRLYNLIWKRFVSCQMPPAVYEKTTITVRGGIYDFQTEGEVMKYAGFEKVYNENAETGADNAKIPSGLQQGESCRLADLHAEQNFTKPQPRFTESTLVKELDKLGIGRPSTYAQIVSTILQRKYVELQERKLHATELGETVNRILIDNFPAIFNVDFTADMENELDDIATAKAPYERVMKNFYDPFQKAMTEVESKKDEIKSNLLKDAGETCDKCGRAMVIRWGRNGRFMACSGFPECKNTKPIEAEAEPEKTDETCDKCQSPMVIKTGRFGKFLACSNYPECKNTRPLTTGVKCPKCKEGDIVERRSKRGKIFFGCSRYPKCDFVSWDKPVHQECPECGHAYMLEKNTKAKGHFLRCPQCKNEIAQETVAN